jgi:hypothetical protein
VYWPALAEDTSNSHLQVSNFFFLLNRNDLIRRQSQEIQILGKTDGKERTLVNVDGTMPTELKIKLFEALKVALSEYAGQDQFKSVDSTQANHPFRALHFQSAARYGPDVGAVLFHLVHLS